MPNALVIKHAKDLYFPNMDKMPENVVEGFLNWAKDQGKDPEVDNKENRKMMTKMACFVRAAWLF